VRATGQGCRERGRAGCGPCDTDLCCAVQECDASRRRPHAGRLNGRGEDDGLAGKRRGNIRRKRNRRCGLHAVTGQQDALRDDARATEDDRAAGCARGGWQEGDVLSAIRPSGKEDRRRAARAARGGCERAGESDGARPS
jgi:hypothetical protein